jgi:hypothetical protein
MRSTTRLKGKHRPNLADLRRIASLTTEFAAAERRRRLAGTGPNEELAFDVLVFYGPHDAMAVVGATKTGAYV